MLDDAQVDLERAVPSPRTTHMAALMSLRAMTNLDGENCLGPQNHREGTTGFVSLLNTVGDRTARSAASVFFSQTVCQYLLLLFANDQQVLVTRP